jgi:hypothetical protein
VGVAVNSSNTPTQIAGLAISIFQREAFAADWQKLTNLYSISDLWRSTSKLAEDSQKTIIVFLPRQICSQILDFGNKTFCFVIKGNNQLCKNCWLLSLPSVSGSTLRH